MDLQTITHYDFAFVKTSRRKLLHSIFKHCNHWDGVVKEGFGRIQSLHHNIIIVQQLKPLEFRWFYWTRIRRTTTILTLSVFFHLLKKKLFLLLKLKVKWDYLFLVSHFISINSFSRTWKPFYFEIKPINTIKSTHPTVVVAKETPVKIPLQNFSHWTKQI
jgi:hypothetical protein